MNNKILKGISIVILLFVILQVSINLFNTFDPWVGIVVLVVILLLGIKFSDKIKNYILK